MVQRSPGRIRIEVRARLRSVYRWATRFDSDECKADSGALRCVPVPFNAQRREARPHAPGPRESVPGLHCGTEELEAHGGTMTKETSSVSGCTVSPTCDGKDQRQ
jgi:hypothetical protein